MNLRDIAQLAGVSRSTVSRVINHDPRVSSDARARVQRVIADVGYRPNAAARALASRRAQMIGLVFHPDFANWGTDRWFQLVLSSIMHESQRRDLGLMVILGDQNCHDDVQNIHDRFVAPRLVDALITVDGGDRNQLAIKLAQVGVAHVGIGESPAAGISFVDVDHRTTARSLTSMLIDEGGSRYALIRGPQGFMNWSRREQGFFDALRQAGISAESAQVWSCAFDDGDVERAVTQVVESSPAFDSLFCASDWIAHRALPILAARGVRIPDDMRVVSFDDFEVQRNDALGLTAAVLPINELATAAVESLLTQLANPMGAPLHTWIQAEVRVRGSSGVDPSVHRSAGVVEEVASIGGE